ncbi:MAG: NAD(+) synthase, partial [Chthoniobacterales bacterium]
GYTCADLFYELALIDAARAALGQIAEAVGETGVAAVVGLPLAVESRLYNCAVVVTVDGVAGIVPKTCLPTSAEFYEERWFARATTLSVDAVPIGDWLVPIGNDLIFADPADDRLRLGIEVCEDVWGAEPMSGPLATAGATVIANPSASNEILGKSAYRRGLVRSQSARCLAGYLYASAGAGESSTDVVYSGHCLIAECGKDLAETERFGFGTTWKTADIDLDHIRRDRQGNSTFSASAADDEWRLVPMRLGEVVAAGALRREVARTPFIPAAGERRAADCREIFAIQSTGLARRLRHTGSKTAVIGLSGGLDSTLALLVTIRALAAAGLDASAVVAVVMPGPGSSDRTQGNAQKLAGAVGADVRVIPIGDAVAQHLEAIGHPEGQHDATYENVQARERTQLLMSVANQTGGIVVGTGDLSELALGWCTYNGDQMSMYHVNAGVPKTLVKYLIEWCADEEFEGDVVGVLRDIVDTPISPELVPTKGGIQETETAIGRYLLHDFFLYHTVRLHERPTKVLKLAKVAFDGEIKEDEIRETLRTFYRRFFANQFKRSAMPDGPKVGTVALSPRGDWRMPSDASSALWLAELDRA